MLVPVSTIPVLSVAIVLGERCMSGSGSGLGATPLFLSKNCPVMECLSHSPPGAGGRSQPAPTARLIPAGRLPAPPAAGPGGGRRGLRRRRGPRCGCGGRATARGRRSRPRGPRSRALGSRRASAAWSKATCSAWARWTETTAVRRCAVRAPVRGSGGCPPGRPLLRQRRERPGVRRGAQHPLASPSV